MSVVAFAVFFMLERTGKSILVKVLLYLNMAPAAAAFDIMAVNAGNANVVTPDAGEVEVPAPNAPLKVDVPSIVANLVKETEVNKVQPTNADANELVDAPVSSGNETEVKDVQSIVS